jgi:transposase-like protein
VERISVMTLANRVQTEADAYAYLETLRWGQDRERQGCPHCASTRPAYFLNPANGVARKTRTGSASQRRVWKCRDCRKQFSVLTGTIFHGSKVSVRTWLFVVFEMCANKNGISAREVERKYELTAKTAWFVLHRIREAMKREPVAGMLRGTVVANEAFIGGKAKYMHRSNPRRAEQTQGGGGKTAVLSLIHEGTVRSQVVNDVTGATLHKAIAEHVDMGNTVLHTDGARAYPTMRNDLAGHETVNHNAGEYVRGNVTTNAAEGYFSQLKRSLDGTHHHVSRQHLPRYLAEFDYRYNSRKLTDTQRMHQVIARVDGRRLTYRPLTNGQ